MTSPCWNYPVLLEIIGTGQRPGRAALRSLAKRMRQEAFREIGEPEQRRRQVRHAIGALLRPLDG